MNVSHWFLAVHFDYQVHFHTVEEDENLEHLASFLRHSTGQHLLDLSSLLVNGNMGYAFQLSCFLIPDSKATCSVQNLTQLDPGALGELIERRRVQLKAIFCNARIWAMSILLPLNIIWEEVDFYAVLSETAATLFGEQICEKRINCKLWSTAAIVVRLMLHSYLHEDCAEYSP